MTRDALIGLWVVYLPQRVLINNFQVMGTLLLP